MASTHDDTSEPLRLYCRKTKQPVLMRIGEPCPHCRQTSHGADLTRLNREVSRLREPLSANRPRLSREAADARMPPPPYVLANSIDEVAHDPPSRVRAARTVKVSRGGDA